MQKQTQEERRREYYTQEATPFSELCLNCLYFVRHYVHFEKERYVQIDTGHCKNGRLKTRRAYDVCDKFVNKYYDDEIKN